MSSVKGFSVQGLGIRVQGFRGLARFRLWGLLASVWD